MSRLVDMHIPPALRRWTMRLVLALVVATVIGYVPGQVLRRDPRTAKLREQIEALDAEARALAAGNAALRREIRGLRTDTGAIEERARADLGMVYPDEVVFRLASPAVDRAGPEERPAEDRARSTMTVRGQP